MVSLNIAIAYVDVGFPLIFMAKMTSSVHNDSFGLPAFLGPIPQRNPWAIDRQYDSTRKNIIGDRKGENDGLIRISVLPLMDANNTWRSAFQRHETPANGNASKIAKVQISQATLKGV